MNLPLFSELKNDESTYLTFSKALLDFDNAVANDTEYYFSKAVALKLPNWQQSSGDDKFFCDNINSLGITGLTIASPPNLIIPKVFQYYMENIIRNNISITDQLIEEITEIAFWKTLSYLGLSDQRIRDCFTFTNGIFTNNFIKTETNNGWVEIVVQIPNKCKLLVPAWKKLDNISDLIQTNDDLEIDPATGLRTITPLYDNGNKQFLFGDDLKQVIDFNNITWNETTKQIFDFNVLLLFYRDNSVDSLGNPIDKLHGINFIYPFDSKSSYWDQELLTQKTNSVQSRGYQFIFNMKSVGNQKSELSAYEQNEQMFYVNNFSKTLGLLDSFLENEMLYHKH